MTLGIQITTLGEVSLKLVGEPSPVKLSRKAETLFIYLACTGQTFSRETLADLFWESEEPGASLNSLRVTLAQLRPHFEDYLNISRNQVSINQAVSAPYYLDTQVMQDHLARAARLVQDHTGAIIELEKAVEIYKGPFLAGWYLRNCPRFEQWQFARQQFFEQAILGALQQLVESHLADGNFSQAINYVQRWLDLDPFNEEAHRQNMRLLFFSGQRQAALEYFSRCEKLLREELKINPSQATVDLYREILEGKNPTGLTPPVKPLSRPASPPLENTWKSPLSSNFPFPVTSMVGRKVEIYRICELLNQPSLRLLTLTGFGGSGKTRLASEVAIELSEESRFKDGITFIPLASYQSPDEVVVCLVQLLGLSIDPRSPLLDIVKNHLRNQQHLLIFDNFEHILGAAEIVSELLKSAPGLKVLATSRERLDIYGEQLYPVRPLAMPKNEIAEKTGPAPLLENPSVQLLVERIKAFDPDFEVTAENASKISQICIRLEGLPLAIELAAARTRSLSLDALMGQLDRRIKVLTGGPSDFADRQRTMWSTIDWSYRLLPPELKQTFRWMSVVASSLDETAARAIFDQGRQPLQAETEIPGATGSIIGERLNLLVEKNLLLKTAGDASGRFGMLKTLAEFAFEQLQANGEAIELQSRYVLYFTDLAEKASGFLKGEAAQAAANQLNQNYPEILNSLHWAEENDLNLAVRLLKALSFYWETQGYHQQARRYLQDLLARFKNEDTVVRMNILDLLVSVIWKQGDYTAVDEYYHELLEYYQAHNNLAEIAEIKFKLLVMAFQKGDMKAARQLLEENLVINTRLENRIGLAGCYTGFGALASEKGEFEEALTNHTRALEIYREEGDTSGTITALSNLGTIATRQHDYLAARGYYEESLQILANFDRPMDRAVTLNNLGLLAVSKKNYGEADQYYVRALEIYEEIGQLYGQCNVLIDRALVAYYCQETNLALSYLERAFSIARKMDNIFLAVYALAGVSCLMGQQGQFREAVRLGEGALSLAALNGFVIEDLYREPLEESLIEAQARVGAELYSELRKETGEPVLETLIELALRLCPK